MCLLRVSHRRGVVSNKIFSRGIFRQLLRQREVWLGRNRHRARIRAPEMGLSAAAPVQRAGAEAGPRLLGPQRDQRAGWLIYAASRLCDAGLFADCVRSGLRPGISTRLPQFAQQDQVVESYLQAGFASAGVSPAKGERNLAGGPDISADQDL